MLLIDWDQPRPSFEESRGIWDREVFKPVHCPEQEPSALLELLRPLFENGGAKFARVAIVEDRCLDWFGSRNRLDEIGFFEHLVKSSAIRELHPDLQPLRYSNEVKWKWASPYTLDGEFAALLKGGGAYKAFEGTGIEAKRIGQEACERLFKCRYEELLLYVTYSPWSEWFRGIAWDVTWVGVDKALRTAWMLCITDTD